MRIYEDDTQSPDGWNITSTLKLDDDGRFRYDETWADYTNATLGPLSVEGSVGGWAQGQERKGIERGDTLDFGDGFTLGVRPEREEGVPVRTTVRGLLRAVREASDTHYEVAPGERVRVVARGPGGMGGLEVVRGADEVVVYGWSGSRVAVIPEQKKAGKSLPTGRPAPKRPSTRSGSRSRPRQEARRPAAPQHADLPLGAAPRRPDPVHRSRVVRPVGGAGDRPRDRLSRALTGGTHPPRAGRTAAARPDRVAPVRGLRWRGVD